MSKTRFLGIEFGRGLSTYAVILVHSGDETWGLPISSIAIEFRHLFYFAVPFFLATAFYFVTTKSEIGYSRKFWQSRVERILIPYVTWSMLFLISRVIVFTLTHKPNRVQQLLQDPLSLVFMGGVSYHLYFLPLLFAGTVLTLLMPLLDRLKVRGYRLGLISMLGVSLYWLLEATGNSFQLGEDIAFEKLLGAWGINFEQYPGLRLVMVEVAWVIRCLPYFLISLSLNWHPQQMKYLLAKIQPTGWITLFVLCNLLGRKFLPGALSELLLAYSLLFSCLSVSNYFAASFSERFMISVGACSFGIYLIHPFIMNTVKPVVTHLWFDTSSAISVASMLVISIPTFLFSWLLVAYLAKSKNKFKHWLGI